MKVTFIGHRTVEGGAVLRERLVKVAEGLIADGADIFLLGSRGEFNDLSYEVITELKERYPHIRRVNVRAEYEYINDEYEEYLLSYYEESYFPEALHGAGGSVYVKRNKIMIDECDAAVVYYNEDYSPVTKTRSGTAIAVEYAKRKKLRIINVY